jgi:hypothetical protein
MVAMEMAPAGKGTLGTSGGEVKAVDFRSGLVMIALSVHSDLTFHFKILFSDVHVPKCRSMVFRTLCSSLRWWRTTGRTLEITGKETLLALRWLQGGAVGH